MLIRSEASAFNVRISKGNDNMKKLAYVFAAIAALLVCAVPALAAGTSPQTGDKMMIVLIALGVAAAAIVITLIFTRKKK